jgi:hypothetical protein
MADSSCSDFPMLICQILHVSSQDTTQLGTALLKYPAQLLKFLSTLWFYPLMKARTMHTRTISPHWLTHLALVCALSHAPGSFAQTSKLGMWDKLKPGLWETSTQIQSEGNNLNAIAAAMQKQMAAMSPEQRKKMQDIMAQQGVQFSSDPQGGMAVKVCISKEMIERNLLSLPPEGGCTQTASPRSGNSMQFTFKCENPERSGKGEMHFSSPEAYTSSMTMTATHKGAPQTTDIKSSGKWLGSDCGTLKPLQIPAR